MTYATKIDGAWALVYPGMPFVDAAGISRPGNWLELASDAERNAARVYVLPDPDVPPTGKIEKSRVPSGDTRPVWLVTYEDTPEPQPPEPPAPIEKVTNSDWRVGLILWGRFDEIEAKIIEARDSGTQEGKIVWTRWEYANEVFRSELMAYRESFGFTVEEVDESLLYGAMVTEQTRSQAEAILAQRQASTA